jgi:hypothetical protein
MVLLPWLVAILLLAFLAGLASLGWLLVGAVASLQVLLAATGTTLARNSDYLDRLGLYAREVRH